MNFKEVVAYCEVAPDGPWVAGGSVRKEVMGLTQDADYDIFFKDAGQFEYLSNIFDETTVTTNVSEFSRTYDIEGAIIQLCCPSFHATPKETIDNFDFTVCQYIYDGEDFLVGETAKADWDSKVLKIVPGCTKLRSALYHSQAYIARGLRFTTETMDTIVNCKDTSTPYSGKKGEEVRPHGEGHYGLPALLRSFNVGTIEAGTTCTVRSGVSTREQEYEDR